MGVERVQVRASPETWGKTEVIMIQTNEPV